jgi:glutaredoxin 2
MAINCALTDDQINNLYKHVYASMIASPEAFDVTNYMRDLFQSIKNKAAETVPEEANLHAAKFLQVVPRLIADIALENPNINVDLNTVRNSMFAFENPSKGLEAAIKELNSADQQQKALKALKQLYKERFDSFVEPNDDGLAEEDDRFLPLSAITSTNQQLEPRSSDDRRKGFKEIRSQRKKQTYEVLQNIRDNVKTNEDGSETYVYIDGEGNETEVALKAVKVEVLKSKHKSKEIFLDKVTYDDYQRADKIQKQKSGITDTNLIDRIALVLTDKNGKILHIDNEGKVTDGSLNAHPIISYQRIVKEVGDRYEVVNHEGEPSIQNPGQIATKNLDLSIEEIDAVQQKQFKKLYEFQQKVKSAGESQTLPITGFSAGAIVHPSKRIVELSAMLPLDTTVEKVLATLEYYDAPVGIFIKGQSSVEIDGQKYLLKTPLLPTNIAEDIIAVLSDPKIDNEVKYDFHNQFIYKSNSKLLEKNKHQKHSIIYHAKTTGALDIFYLAKGQTSPTIITINKGEALSESDKALMREALLNPMGEGKAVRMHFTTQDTFNKYEEGKLTGGYRSDYYKFLSTLNLQIDTVNGPVNGYMFFSIPKEAKPVPEQQPAEEKTNQDYDKVTPTNVENYRELKDKVVEKLKAGETLNILSVSKVDGQNQRYNIVVEGVGVVEFYNKISQPGVTPETVRYQPEFPVTLELSTETFTDALGRVEKDLVTVVQNGKPVGSLRVNTSEEFKRLREVKEQKKATANPKTTSNVKQASESVVEKQSDNKAKKKPNKGYDLDRSSELSNKVSEKQIKAAKEWWSKSPLSKLIDFEVLADVVNSDAFAKFIIDGSTLSSPEMLAKIELYKDGSMVDIYHEAWHGFSQLFLTKDQKTELYAEVRNSNKKYKDYTDLQVEELLAEDFRTYAKNQKSKPESPKRNTLFRKIWNFLKSLFGKLPKMTSKRIANNPNVKDLYDKLYFASENPSLLAEYKPSLENVMFGEMNRAKAISSVTAGKKYVPVLSVSDSTLISETIDSIISDIVDEQIADTGKKSMTLAILRGKNRHLLYEDIKNELEVKLEDLQEQLQKSRDKVGNKQTVEFNSLKTEADLSKNASVIITRKDGSKVYGFVSSQIENVDSLYPDLKKGDKVKGQVYHNINLVTDFYKHKEIKYTTDKDKKVGVPIIVGTSQQELIDQYINFQEDPVANTWKNIDIKKTSAEPLTTEQSKIQNNIKLLEIALANFGDADQGVIKYHLANTRFDFLNAEKLAKQEETDEEGNELYETDIEENTEDFADRKVGKKSVWDTAHPEIKYLVSSLHAIDKKTGKPKVNKLGFKELADASFIWGHMVKNLTGLQSPEKMLNALGKLAKSSEEDATKVSIPEIKQLFNKLPSLQESSENTNSFDMISALFHSFNKTEAPYLQTTFMETSPGVFEAHVLTSSMKETVVISNWSNKFKFQKPNADFVSLDANNTRTLILSNIINRFGDASGKLKTANRGAFYFLQAIGIKMDDLIEIKNELTNKDKYYGAQYIFEALKYAADIQSKSAAGTIKLSDADTQLLKDLLQDPVNTLNKEYTLYNRTFNNRTNVSRLAELNAELGIEAYSAGIPNAAGDTVFPHIENNTITRVINALRDGNSLAEVFENNPYVSFLSPSVNSYTSRLTLLNSVFDKESGEKYPGAELDVFMNSGTRIVYDKAENEGVNTTDLDAKSYLLQGLHSMLLAGVQEMPRHASKKTSMGIKTRGPIRRNYYTSLVKEDTHLYIPTKGFVKEPGIEQEAIKAIIIPHIAGEFDRIRAVRNNKEKYGKLSGYNTPIKFPDGKTFMAGELFTAFDNVLSKDTKEKLYALNTKKYEGIALEEILDKEQTDLQDQVIADVKNYFAEMTQDIEDNIKTTGFIATNLLEKTGLDLSDPQLKMEARKAVIKSYAYNSFIHNFETAILTYGDMAQVNHLKEEMHKRNTGATSGGPGFRTDSYAKAFINSQKWTQNSYANSLEGFAFKPYTGILKTAVVRDNEIEKSIYSEDIVSSLEEYYISIGKSKAEAKALAEKDGKPYKGMEEGDGAGYINIDAYRNLKKLENDWSEAQEDLFKKMVNKEELNPAEVVEMFPPYKLQNYGHLADQSLPSLAMHKFALFPLIPNMIKNSDLEKLHRRMLKTGTDYVTFKTGSKGVSVTSDGKPDRLYDDNGQMVSEDTDFTNNPVYAEYLKKSSSVNHYFKGKIVYPTQKRGLILNHLYDKGFADKNDPELQKLGKAYTDLVAEYSSIVKLELLEEIGYVYDSATDSYVGNHRKFLELVNAELEARDVPKHLLNTIETDIDGYAKNDLSYHIKADKIEQVLVSLIEKRLIKQEVKGEPLVQMPATMFNGIWDKTPEVLGANDPKIKSLIGSNNLPFYNKNKNGTEPMRIAIALQGPFLKLLEAEYNGKKIGDIDTLNVAIKDPEWLKDNQDAIRIVGDRIPIQDHGSLEVAQIHHFLPANMTNVVVVPTEMVAKAGSDFDVDKIFWQFTELDDNGKVIESQYTAEQLEVMLKNPDTKSKAKKEIAKKKKALNNSLIKANANILLSPKIYAYLVKPNNTYLWTDLASSMEKYYDNEYNRYKTYHNEGDRKVLGKDGKEARIISPTRTLEPLYQVHKLTVNMVGKDGLGIVALENKIHPILKSVGMKMPKDITLMLNGKYTNVKLPFSLMFNHNKTAEGNVSLGSDLNVNGVKIADLNSHLMNGLVDVEKDAWVFYVRANVEQLPTMNFLIQSGVSEQQLTYFLSQPLIRQYIDQVLETKSMYYKLGTSENNRTAKWQIFGNLIQQTLGTQSYKNLLIAANSRKYQAALNSLKDNDKVQTLNKEVTIKDLKRSFAATKKIIPFEHDGIQYKSTTNLSNTLLLPFVEQILKEQTGITEFTEEILLKGLNDQDPNVNALALAHYLNLGNQIRSYGDAKQLFNPDTKVSKSANMSFSRNENLKHIKNNPNVDQESITRLEKESVLSSFFDNDVSNKLLRPLFELRLDPKVLKFMNDTAFSQRSTITRKYGRGDEGKSKFFANYSNAIINTILQNNLSYVIGKEGNIENLPANYGPYDVVVDNTIDELSKVQSDKILINDAKLKEIYDNPKLDKEEFPNTQLFYKYYLEFAVQKHMYPEKSKEEIMQRAKIFSFNPHAMLKSDSGYSVKLLDLVKNTEFIGDYSILDQLQIADYPARQGFNLLTLANKRDISPALADEYSNQLLQLADPTVMKVKSKERNYEISEYFSMFTEALLYQHGMGYSINGIVDVLPQKELIGELALMGQKFMNNQLASESPAILETIAKTLLQPGSVKSYVQTVVENFNNPDYIEDFTIDTEDHPSEPAQLDSTQQSTQPTVSTTKVLEGDIFTLPGIPVITTNLGGVHGAGLAQAAKTKGLITQGDGNFKATDTVVQLPVKKKWSDSMAMNNNMELLKESLRSLIRTARDNKSNTYLLPLAGLGHGEGSIKDILPLLIKTVQAEDNIKLVLPAENVNLGRQGTVRKDTTRENLSKIKEMLSQAGLFGKDAQQSTQLTASNNPAEFTNHSGGAIGADTQWDNIGKEFNMVNNKHYWTQTKTPKGNTEISQEDFQEGRFESAKAAKRNFGYQYAAMKDSRLIRNWSQVKNSDAVFAIGQIVKTGEKIFPDQTNDTRVAQAPSVTGGTGYAVGMAINNNKPAFVFNQTKNSYEVGWYKWDSNLNDFIKVETPVLTKNFAGIGTRNINEAGKQAIRDVYANTFKDAQASTTIDSSTERSLTPEEQEMLNSLPKFTAQIKTKGGKSLLALGITTPEWDALTDLEKITLLNCN